MTDQLASEESFSPIYHLTGGDTIGAKPMNFRRKAYSYWCIEYTVEGAGYLCVDDKRYDIKSGDVYILPKGKDHEYGPDKKNPWRKLYIVIDGPLIEELTRIYGIHDTYYFPHQQNTQGLFENSITQLKQKTEQTKVKISLYIHEIITQLAKQVERGYENEKGLAGKIKRYLDGNLENPLTLENLVKEFLFSKAHIVREFKKQYSITPYEYFLRRKFHLSCFYLTETDLSIKQIADKLHFRDEYYFSKFFKKRANIPPGQYRKKI